MHNTSHDEVVCYFKNETKHCGGRTCGAHGICIDLKQFQDSFDSGDGKESFRCSCQRGFHDDGTSCVPVDCGPRTDPLGKWTGDTTYLGEYTLECDEGAFLWGSSQQAITITCPGDGVWKSHPVCRNPEQAILDAEFVRFRFWSNVCMAITCVVCAALAAGLTMGLVSLDEREMQIIDEANLEDCNTQEEKDRLRCNKDAAKRIAPMLKDHHRLLVTLLLLNALANEALPIFLDDLMPPWLALLVSVTFVLLCGEIIPSAIFTGPMQLTVAARFIPCVECLQFVFSCIARPIGGALDRYLPHDEDQLYSRPEIKAVLCLHSQGGDPRVETPPRTGVRIGDECTPPARPSSRESQEGSSRSASTQPFLSLGSPSPMAVETPMSVDSDSPGGRSGLDVPGEKGNPNAPLTSLETELCLNVLRLGELRVHACEGFCSLRVCSKAFFAAPSSTSVHAAIKEAAAAGKSAVVVFRTRNADNWPAEVHPDKDLMGVLPLSALLGQVPTETLGSCCRNQKPLAIVRAEDNVLDALKSISSRESTPCAYAAVLQRNEFAGLLDGERALMELLGKQHRQENDAPKRLDPDVQKAVSEAAWVMGSTVAGGSACPSSSPFRAPRRTSASSLCAPFAARPSPTKSRGAALSSLVVPTLRPVPESDDCSSPDSGPRSMTLPSEGHDTEGQYPTPQPVPEALAGNRASASSVGFTLHAIHGTGAANGRGGGSGGAAGGAGASSSGEDVERSAEQPPACQPSAVSSSALHVTVADSVHFAGGSGVAEADGSEGDPSPTGARLAAVSSWSTVAGPLRTVRSEVFSEPESPIHRRDGPLRGEIGQAFLEFEQEAEGAARRPSTNRRCPPRRAKFLSSESFMERADSAPEASARGGGGGGGSGGDPLGS
mmetsp:Transcript_118807/g.378970  ORF Transcript_118807/g.378970 Transcript_118807/m.378970 type:complete len:891 (+) Transcript_118807:666-3338(+)